MFKIGDRVRIVKKVKEASIGWPDQMNYNIGKEGTVVNLYKTGGILYGYKVETSEAPPYGEKIYTYPIESLEPAQITHFNMGDIVLIYQKPDDEEILDRADWMDDMDDYVGLEGEIGSYNEHGNSYIVTVVDKDGDELQEYYFPFEALKLVERRNKDNTSSIWFLGVYSGYPYKQVKEEGGYIIAQAEDGTEVSTKYVRLEYAPRECKGFDYRKEKLPYVTSENRNYSPTTTSIADFDF